MPYGASYMFTANIVGFLIDMFVLFLVIFNTFMDKRKKRYFILIASFMTALTLLTTVHSILIMSKESYACIVLNIVQGLSFALVPITLFFIVMMLTKLDTTKIHILTLPLIANIIINLVSIFQPGVAFHYSQDLSYEYGPMYFVTPAVSIYVVLLAFYFTIKEYQYKSIGETIFVACFFVITGVVFFLEISIKLPYLFYNVLSASILGYYAALTTISTRRDPLSGVYNRSYYNYYTRLIDGKKNAFILMYDCNSLKIINDTFGHNKGDQVIKMMGEALILTFGRKASIFRYGGDEFFVIVTNGKYYTQLENFNRKFAKLLQDENIEVAYGAVYYDKNIPLEVAIEQVDKVMYNKKQLMKSINKEKENESN